MTTIGIIGAGEVGSQIARAAIKAGYDVVLANSRGPETLRDLIAELGPRARASTAAEAAEAGDFVVISVPLRLENDMPTEQLAGKIVLDTNNYMPWRDGNYPIVDSGEATEHELRQRQLPTSKVAKAFTHIQAPRLFTSAGPAGSPTRHALSVSSDYPEAVDLVTRLYNEFGFDTIDNSPLSESWRSGPGTAGLDSARASNQGRTGKQPSQGATHSRRLSDHGGSNVMANTEGRCRVEHRLGEAGRADPRRPEHPDNASRNCALPGTGQILPGTHLVQPRESAIPIGAPIARKRFRTTREPVMQVGSSSDIATQLQALRNAAFGQYKSSQDFSVLLQTTGSGSGADAGSAVGSGPVSSGSSSSSSSSSTGDWQLSGNFSGGAVYAVGTFGADGQLNMFSQQQIQGELDAIQTQGKAAYSDALQNFMALSQASGQLADTTMTTETQFTGDNGLIGGNFDTSLSLKQIGGGVPSA